MTTTRIAARAFNALAVFDLDDTLIDTTGVLVPAALANVAHAVDRDVAVLNARGKRIDEVLAGVLDLTTAQRADAAAAWYATSVPALELLKDADAMLTALADRVHLALLTRGNAERQWAKIRACNLEQRFESIRIRDIEGEGSKADDLRSLMNEFHVSAAKTAVIGDDPTDEIHHGGALGCVTILVPDTPLSQIVGRLKKSGLVVDHEDTDGRSC